MSSSGLIKRAAVIVLLAGTSLAQAEAGRLTKGERLSTAIGILVDDGTVIANGPGNGRLTNTVAPRLSRSEAYRRKVARDLEMRTDELQAVNGWRRRAIPQSAQVR